MADGGAIELLMIWKGRSLEGMSTTLKARVSFFLILAACLFTMAGAEDQKAELRSRLGEVKHKIVYETCRDDNWELFIMNADGSNPTNLTNTPDVDEHYAKASPDGTRICFLAREKDRLERCCSQPSKVLDIYYMNVDGTGRTRIAEHAGSPCWSPDGTAITRQMGIVFPQRRNGSMLAGRKLAQSDSLVPMNAN